MTSRRPFWCSKTTETMTPEIELLIYAETFYFVTISLYIKNSLWPSVSDIRRLQWTRWGWIATWVWTSLMSKMKWFKTSSKLSQLHLQAMKSQNSLEASTQLFKIPTSNNQIIYFYGLLALGVVSSDTNFRICGGRVLGVEH